MIEELKALKLECGSLYAIEMQESIGEVGVAALREQLKQASEEFGVRFVLLSKNLKLVRDDALAHLPQ
jgi:hypothetical protein